MNMYLTLFLSFYLSCLTQAYAEEKPSLPLTTPLLSSTEATAFTLSATTGIVVPTTYPWLARAAQITQIHSQVTTSGLSFGIPSQRAAYSNLMQAGNQIASKVRLIEQIGDAGARAYARSIGYTPLYQGVPGQGKGFDQVYRKGRQVIVLEAKGGGSPLGKYYGGLLQGTPEYTLKVANNTLHSQSASPAAKQAAKEVIQAYKEGQLVIEVAHTKHVAGEPKLTNVDTTYGEISLPSSLEVAHKISLTVGVTGALFGGTIDLMSQLATSQEIDWERVGGMTVLSGISGYGGSLTGLMLEHALVNNQIQLFSHLVPTSLSASLLSSLSGGMATTALFAYGAYFLGYSDLNFANRSVMAGAIGSAAGALGVMTTLQLVAAFGTASTGTAIASLSGAAATNASLAWLGGGSLAAGGGGVAVGSTILTAGAALVVIGIGAGVMYICHLNDEKTERARVGHLLASVQQGLK